MALQLRHFVFEYILLVYTFPGLLQHFIPSNAFNAALLLLTLTAYKIEGFRDNLKFLILGLSFSTLPITVLQLVGWLLVLYSIVMFPNYYYKLELDPASTKFNVGYKRIEFLDTKDKLSISIYYPTQEKTNKSKVLMFPDAKWWERNYAVSILYAIKNIPPNKLYFQLMKSYQKHLTIPVNANATILDTSLLQPNQNKAKQFPVILLEPGLNAFDTQYNVICTYLASCGFILIALDHIEIVWPVNQYEKDRFANEYKANYETMRKNQMETRAKQIQRVMDYVHNGLSQDLKIERDAINYSNVSIIAHSIGGGSAAHAVSIEYRINGLLILLDPYLYFMNDKELNKGSRLPLLLLWTMEFAKRPIAKKVEENNRIYASASQKNNTLCLRFNNAEHGHYYDMKYMVPDKGKDRLESVLFSQQTFVRMFLEEMLYKNKNLAQFIKDFDSFQNGLVPSKKQKYQIDELKFNS